MADERLRGNALVCPYVLNPLEQTNRGCLPNVMAALDEQTLDGAGDFRKLPGATLLLKL